VEGAQRPSRAARAGPKAAPTTPAASRALDSAPTQKPVAASAVAALAAEPASAPAVDAPASAVPTGEGADESAGRLFEILAPVLAAGAEEERAQRALQELTSARRALEHAVVFLRDASAVERVPGARMLLESVLDTASELRDALAAAHAQPAAELAEGLGGLEIDDSTATVALSEDEDGEAGLRPEVARLEFDLGGLEDEVRGIREALCSHEDLAHLAAGADSPTVDLARSALTDLHRALRDVLDESLHLLTRLPLEPPPEPVVESLPPLVPSAAPPAAPEPAAIPRPAPNAQETGLALAPEAELPPLSAGGEEEPALEGPDYAHRSEEEAVHWLQEFFDVHSPDGTLARGDEREFARMARQILKHAFPDLDVTEAQLVGRIKVLKDTLALRKRLKNALTLREFRALVAK
jgi:hypothetical protein